MFSRFTTHAGFILACCFIQGCSSPESQERLDTALCWLRPSCLPSQTPKSKTIQKNLPEKTLAKPAKSKPSRAQQKTKVTQQSSLQNLPEKKCSAQVKTSIQDSKSDIKDITITYNEPTTKADGKPLDNLDKTTIYYDLGKGEGEQHIVCRASTPLGGGAIEEKIYYTTSPGESLKAKICVTATNRPLQVGKEGQEGPPICQTITKH